ncbi:hypothetical protein [Neorhizobium sp. 2083]|uniref:hypothetical protein n=1 Tax=Neorhizobium sp. 2083 TaxID=2817762 RepID=UPI002869F53F|nr:hypothetical protein [Neorhizobium sp. 2083]
MGGADIFRQALAGGLVDEIELHIVPVLLVPGLACSTRCPIRSSLSPPASWARRSLGMSPIAL